VEVVVILVAVAKHNNTSTHIGSHQQHRNGIKKAGKVPLWFPKGMNGKFLRNVKYTKAELDKKKKDAAEK
jgi:hypothetical protein